MAEPSAGRPAGRVGAADVLIGAAFLTAGALVVPALAAAPTLGAVLAGGGLLVALTALWPVGAVCAYLALDPLLVGLERGHVVPNLRLNELLLIPVLAGLAPVVLGRWRRSDWRVTGVHRLDVVVVALAFCSSVSTLLWMFARGRVIDTEDLLYALTLWKLAVIYALVRLILRDLRAVRWVLGAIVASAGVVGLIGLLEVLGVGIVTESLGALLAPGEGNQAGSSRAASTLGNPIAYGDVVLYGAVIAAALASRLPGRGGLLWLVAGALSVCALASGQVSIVLGLLTAGIVFALATRTVGRATLAAVGVLAAALPALQPVLAARLSYTDARTGLPPSWVGPHGRLENLRHYFWPKIGADFNWLFGVRTAGRVPGEEYWRPWVWIESGYTWALWTGGLPLLVAVLTLLVVTARMGRRLATAADPVIGAMGTTLTTVAWTLAVLLIFDPHLTYRGAGDFLFVLLALGATLDLRARPGASRDEHPVEQHRAEHAADGAAPARQDSGARLGP